MSATAAPQRTGARSSDLLPPGRLAPEHAGGVPHPLLALQRAFGNQLVQRHLLADAVQLQPEMEVTRPDDEYEREADRVADTVMRMPDPAVARQVAEHEKKKEAKPPPAPKPPEVKPAPPPKPREVKKEPPKARKPEEKKKEEPAKVARKAAATAVPQQVSEPAATSIRAQGGGGQPLPAAERSFFEPRTGRDLGGVRIHDDPVAARTASELGARAFTHGQDVFFAQGRYQPGTETGRRLLAHELTHTIQQRGDSLGRMVQRYTATQVSPSTQAAASGGTAAPPPGGGEAKGGQALQTGKQLPVPNFRLSSDRKDRYAQKFFRSKGYTGSRKGLEPQRDIWERELTARVKERLKKVVPEKTEGFGWPAGRILVQSETSKPPFYAIGNEEEVARILTRPQWNSEGDIPKGFFQVDHIFELQLSGFPDPSAPSEHKMDNFQLLAGSVNSSSGTQIDDSIEKTVEAHLATLGKPNQPPRNDPQKNLADAQAAMKAYDIHFDGATALKGESAVTAGFDPKKHLWTQKQINDGEHLKYVKAAQWAELSGEPGQVLIFSRAEGGRPSQLTDSEKPQNDVDMKFLKPFEVVKRSFNTADASSPDFGFVAGQVPKELRLDPKEGGYKEFPIQRIPGAPRAGYMNKQAAIRNLKGFAIKGASPIEVDEVDFVPGGLLVQGRINTDVPLLQGSSIDFELLGDRLTLSKEWSLGEFNVPPPFKITSTSLRLFATIALSGQADLGLRGRLTMAIERVGDGFLEAEVTAAEGFALAGGFNFDTKLFTEASIHLAYRQNELSGGGVLAIGEGKVPGIRSARVTADYAHGGLDATGNAELSIPGLQRGTMAFHYSEATGIELGGRFELANNIPGIRGGSLEAHVRERPDHSGYAISATGTAQPAIPDVDSTLTIAYDDGAFTISGHAAYSRGIVSGSIDLGATNRPVDPDGNPIPNAPPGDRLTAYGRGQATVRLTPWLQGIVGIQLRPNGEIVLTGEIGIPSTVDVFPAKNYTRNIVTIGLDIPIIGVAAFGQRIGIFATIQGGLDFDAGVGPGQLQQLRLGITYEPAHEERTHVTGDGLFVIPAHAGLRLFIRGGAGVGIPVVSATVGIEVGGALGLEGAAQAGVHIDWTPSRGLVLDARGEIYVEPKFRFDVSLFALVEASAFGLHYEFYNRRWVLAAIEYGSGLRLGIAFPIHYEQGRPFELDWNQVQFQIPDVSPREVLTGLIERITGE
jgi:hypothetical protein